MVPDGTNHLAGTQVCLPSGTKPCLEPTWTHWTGRLRTHAGGRLRDTCAGLFMLTFAMHFLFSVFPASNAIPAYRPCLDAPQQPHLSTRRHLSPRTAATSRAQRRTPYAYRAFTPHRLPWRQCGFHFAGVELNTYTGTRFARLPYNARATPRTPISARSRRLVLRKFWRRPPPP